MINYCSKYIIHDMTAMVASSVDIGWIVNNFFLEVVVRFVDIGGTVDHLCLAMVASSVDICWIVNNFFLEVVVRFVDIGGTVDHLCLASSVDIGRIPDNFWFQVFVRFVDIGWYIVYCHYLFKHFYLLYKQANFINVYVKLRQ
jgi:hypothetical protein